MMKEMTDFFNRYEKEYFKLFQMYPSVPYSESWNHDLFVGEPDSYEMIRWKAVVQDKALDWSQLEHDIGFKLRDDIKDYFSSYYFFDTTATVGKATIMLMKISNFEEIGKNLLYWASDAKMAFPEKQCILIGMAIIDNDDGYSIYVDNETGAVFCKEFDTMNEVQLSDSISSLFEKMEA